MKTKAYFIFLGSVFVLASILFAARYLSGFWLLDIIVSFLPLVTLGMVGLFIAAYIWTYLIMRNLTPKRRQSQSIISGIILGLTLASIVLSIIQVTSALDNTVLARERDLEKNSTAEIRIAFFNKFYYNYNYRPLIDEVNSKNIDVLGMAELSDENFSDLRANLGFEFSYYRNCHCHNTLSDPVALFSRYPLSNIHTEGLQDSGIIEATATVAPDKEIAIVVIHPDAPMNPELLTRRNQLLDQVDSVMQKYRGRNVILMGDFNLSTWSPTYIHFLQNNTFLKDSARGFGLITSWGPLFIRTLIDHIIISDNIAVKDFSSTLINGSDHAMIEAVLGF